MELYGALIIFAVPAALVLIRGLIHSKSLTAEKRIPPGEIELSDCRIHYPHAFSPRLTGRITNKSAQYTLKTLLLKISLFNADPGKEKILMQTRRMTNINLPPGHSEILSEFVKIGNEKIFQSSPECLCEIIEAGGA